MNKKSDANSSILFSQVREDPSVELYCLEKIEDDKLCVLMIGSGGCTALSLLSTDKNVWLDIVDSNPVQNYLTMLKMALIKAIPDRDTYIKFIEGKLSDTKVAAILLQVDLPTACKEYWVKNYEQIFQGINNVGSFEKLFRELVESNYDYKKIFNREYLTQIFGSDAVIHSLNEEFYTHFTNVMLKYESRYGFNGSRRNYFYHQITAGEYSTNPGADLPPYLQEYDIVRQRLLTIDDDENWDDNIEFENETFEKIYTQPKTLENPRNYHLIHTSNLIDWMDESEIKHMLICLYNMVISGGFLTIRQLNSDVDIVSLIDQEKWEIIEDVPEDRSHFYKRVLVLRKIDDTNGFPCSIL